MPTISTVAGTGTSGSAGNGGAATLAQLKADGFVKYDAAGNLYIVDTGNHAIRKVSGGIITTIAGTLGVSGFSCDGGLATAATLASPYAITFDAAGNMYIADYGNNRIREVTVADGKINTIAGNGTGANYKSNGPALSEPVWGPKGLALDSSGNLYIAATTTNVILELTGGQLNLFAGSSGGGIGGDGSPALTAKFAGPISVFIDAANNLYLTDKAHSNVRKVSSVNNILTNSGIISTVVGSATGTAGNTGDGGLATAALLSGPTCTAVDAAGNIYVDDTVNQKIRMVNAATGVISTFAGTGTSGYTGDGGVASAATLKTPSGVAVSPLTGQVAIADTGNNVVRAVAAPIGSFPATNVGSTSAAISANADVVTADTLQSYQLNAATPADFTFGVVTGCTLPGAQSAGTVCAAPVMFNPTAPGTRINQAVVIDSSNTKYIFPLYGTGNAPAVGLAPGNITSYAGITGTAGAAGDSGAATSALLNTPSGVALDPAGNLYIADTANNKIRMVSSTGTISTYAGNGTAGWVGDGAAPTAAALNAPSDVALDVSGNVYIADTDNHVIRMISAQTGFISTVAGMGGKPGATGDGGAATAALLNTPKGVAVDLAGDIFIADTGNNLIREVNTSGTIITVSGTAGSVLSAPAGVSVDVAGNLYIVDTGNNVVRKLSSGILSIVAGTLGTAGSTGDGAAATSALLNAPTHVVLDAAGDLYISDSGNNKIRFVSAFSGAIASIAGNATPAQLSLPNSVTVDQYGSLYIADTANNRVAKVDSTTTTLAFGSIATSLTSPAQTVAVTNIGNQLLTLNNLTISSNNFKQVPSGGADCNSTTTLAAGAYCLISVNFSPTAISSYIGTITLTDNALNNATSKQIINLSGSGFTPGVPTTLSVAVGNNQAVTPLSTFPTVLSVKVVDQRGNASAGVNVVFTAPLTGASGTFANGTNTITVQTDANGNAATTPITANSTRGVFTVSAVAAGIATPVSFSETISGNPSPQMQVSLAPTSTQTYGQTIQLTANLVPTSMNGISVTGAVTFYDNGKSIGTGTVSNGSATLSYMPSAGTSQAFTASYGGDSNFSASKNTTTVLLTVNTLGITAAVPSITAMYSPSAAPSQSAGFATSGVLTGVLPVDQAALAAMATYTSFGLNYNAGVITGTAVVGVYPITTALGLISPAGNYTVTSTSGTVTIIPAGSTATLTSSNYFPPTGGSITLTAVVASSTTGTPTGSVSFYNGSALLGSGTLASGKATLAIAALPIGPNSLTVVYAGSTNWNGATSASITVTPAVPDFSFINTPSSTVLAQGDSAAIAIAGTTAGSFNSPITFSCSGLPVNAYCNVVPVAVTPTTSTTPTAPNFSVLIQLITSGPGTVIGMATPAPARGSSLAIIFGLPAILLGGLFAPKGRLRKLRQARGLLCGLIVCLIAGLIGCGSGVVNPTVPVITPTGGSIITITAVSGAITHSSTLPLTVVAVRP